MKLYAISDLHLSYEINRQALAALPYYPQDWLILAGDTGETLAHLRYALEILTQRFAQIVWIPGNHDLWTLPSDTGQLRGEDKYRQLVALCHEYNVITPEDPYVRWPGEGPPLLLTPLFLLYDYSFRPDDVSEEQVLAWAKEAQIVCTDQYLLHPDPYASLSAWCAARCQYTENRLLEVLSSSARFIIINHYPLLQSLVRLKYIPRFSPWCGTKRTAQWHTRFPAEIVIYGHLHIRNTEYLDGVRFEEVSLGYPRQWQQTRGLQSYLREILPGPPVPHTMR